MSKLKLVLIRGPADSGKSTLAKTEYVPKGYVHFEANMFFYDEHGVYVFNKNLIKKAHIWCQDQTEKQLQDGNSVVVSNTFIRKIELEPYLELAKMYHADVIIEVCMKKYASLSKIPSGIIRRHIETFEH